MHVAVALIIRLVSAPKQQQRALVSSFTLTPETGRHYRPGGLNSVNAYHTFTLFDSVRGFISGR